MKKDCIFCNIRTDRDIIYENEFGIAFYDGYPVSPGHTLIVPKKHCGNYFELDEDIQQNLWGIVNKCKVILDEQFKPDGYNIGINVNESAGQSVMHVHIHLIPRYMGDIPNPRGGVRGVIPKKRDY